MPMSTRAALRETEEEIGLRRDRRDDPWPPCRLRNGDGLPRNAGRRLGRAAVSSCRPIRSKSPTCSKCRSRFCSTPPIRSGTSACWATFVAITSRFRIGDRYIWGATAAMLMILDRTLRDRQDLAARPQ